MYLLVYNGSLYNRSISSFNLEEYKMKSFTDLEQSKKLAEILPPESADMLWEQHNGNEPYVTVKPWTTIGRSVGAHVIHCWSLAALLDYIKQPLKRLEIAVRTDKNYNVFALIDNLRINISDEFDLVDACCYIILKLKEKNLL